MIFVSTKFRIIHFVNNTSVQSLVRLFFPTQGTDWSVFLHSTVGHLPVTVDNHILLAKGTRNPLNFPHYTYVAKLQLRGLPFMAVTLSVTLICCVPFTNPKNKDQSCAAFCWMGRQTAIVWYRLPQAPVTVLGGLQLAQSAST